MKKVIYGENQQQEMKLAAEQKRQPICVYCEHPIEELRQTQYQYIKWTWNRKKKRFNKDDSCGDADKAFHVCHRKGCCGGCEARDWDFVDEVLVSY